MYLALFIFAMYFAMITNAQTCPDENHPHAIDLGLPSGTRWSCCNLNASLPHEYGGYYAWGETFTKDKYDWSTYSLCNGTEDSCIELGDIKGTSYDVAHVKLGNDWLLPSSEQIQELSEKCFPSFKIVNGVKGIVLRGRNGNSVFFPYAGCVDGLDNNGKEQYGFYWGSTHGTIFTDIAECFHAGLEVYSTGGKRCEGLPVRPVKGGGIQGKTNKEIIQENGFKLSVSPMLTTHWSQDGGENSMLPFVNNEHTKRAVAGCGATALAQVLNYWKYPIHGLGENYYYWHEINEMAQYLYANFQDTHYDWGNMIPIYKNNDSVTQRQKDAVGTLMLQIGVALEMKYKYDSTATQIEYILAALRTYFGYNPNMRLVRQINDAYTMDEWLTMMYRELSEGRPILMGGRYNNSADHIFVADGYDEEGRIHLNMGKANLSYLSSYNKDDYYDLTEVNITYNGQMRMILGICPETLDVGLTYVNVVTPGTLKEAMGGELESRRVCRLKVTGTINKDDFAWLSKLTAITTGQLTYIDLSQCSTVEHSIPTRAFQGCYTLQEILLPNDVVTIESNAFYNCCGLCAVQLPNHLECLGSNVFANCRYLKAIHLPASLNDVRAGDQFQGTQLSKFTIDDNNTYFKIKNNALIGKNGTYLHFMPMEGIITDYELPQGVEDYSPSGISTPYLQKITFPCSIKNIYYSSIKNCTDVYCNSSAIPNMWEVNNTVKRIDRLHVPKGFADTYRASGWTAWFVEIIDDLPANTFISEIPETFQGQRKYFEMSGIEENNPQPNRLYIQRDSNGRNRKVLVK